MNLTPIFGICLLREFTTKLGGYLALNYTHLLLPYKEKYVKIPNEGTKFVHLRKVFEQKYMNAPRLMETYDQDPVIESLLTTKILSINDLNYQVTNVGMGNYCLYDNAHPISITTE